MVVPAMPSGQAADSLALAHDYLLVLRGAERTFAAMADIWPEAPIHTLLYDEHGTEGRFAGREVHTSPLARLRADQQSFRRLLPLFPPAARRLRPGTDVVLSSSSAFAHAVPPAPGGLHVCYCHSPLRYVWHERGLALREVPRAARPALRAVLAGVRAADRRAAARVDAFVANSRLTQERIERFWGRESVIVHPPVEVARFARAEPEDFFLTVGELAHHKRTELSLRAARRAGARVVVVGEGPARPRLEAAYGDVATFAGRVGDTELARLLARARAVIVPNVEEFGIVAVEAQAAGRPVVGVRAGGTAETVADGRTGVLVEPDDPEALAAALREVDFGAFDADELVAQAARFAPERFAERLRRAVADAVAGR